MPAIVLDTAWFMKNWRTTANGLVSAAVMVITAVYALPPGLKAPVYILAGLRALNGFLQEDAGKALVATAEGIKAVDSHEVPNDASQGPVVK